MPGTRPFFALLLAALLLPGIALADDGDAALMQACPGLAAWAAVHPHRSDEATRDDGLRQFTDPALRQQLATRAAADENARDTAITAGMRDKTANTAILAVDADNLAWLKSLVARQGFPTQDAVGALGVSNAWLLVQHADSDPAFQASVLKALQLQPVTSGVRKADVAMLTDRVLRAQGKPQRYASQFVPAGNGSMVPAPTEDFAHVDERRAAMDLMPLSIYQCVLRATYAPSPQNTD